jgi:hypothetical protein
MMALKLWSALSARMAMRLICGAGNYLRTETSPPSSSLCSSQGSSSAASAAREEFFQPKDLVWLDSCDEHRNEEIKQAAEAIPNLNSP